MKPAENIKQSEDILIEWSRACKKLDIPHLLIYGTALGFYRDGEFIKDDTDIDTRVICDKKKWKKLVEELGKKGINQSDKPEGWEFFRHFNGGKIPISIERSEKVGSIIFDNGEEHVVMPLYKTFDKVIYKGREYNLPHPIEEYLERRYGKDWKIPNPNWDAKGQEA